MHICLICIELFGYGVHGGFGRATRMIGRELVRRGRQVTVVVPKRSQGHPAVHRLDGMTIRQFNPLTFWATPLAYRSCHADIYHSEDASLGTFLAMSAMPQKRHLITFRDPLDKHDWEIETRYGGKGSVGWYQYRRYIDNPLVRLAVARAHALYCAAEFLIPKVQKKYALKKQPRFLPTPVEIPGTVLKSENPTVCFVSRWEGRKRPELFFELARKFPAVNFIAVGGAQDKARDLQLRNRYAEIPNLRMTGVIDQFQTDELSQILGKSWILINTSLREGLPNAFLEAAAHRCALLSMTDPDRFASRFGALAQEGGLEAGLDFLLSGNRWKSLGEAGCDHVRNIFATEIAMRAHMDAYDEVLEKG